MAPRPLLALLACVTFFFGCESGPTPMPAVRCIEDADGTVSVASLIEDIADLERLARRDRIPYERRLASSTRRNTSPSDPRSWYDDEKGIIRIEGDERVIFESAQPGAIVRFWSANPNGRVRFYFDGEATPSIDDDLVHFLAPSEGAFAAPFVYVSARGFNLVHPISWTRSMKVTISSTSLYYTLDVREYADDIVVERYPGASSDERRCAEREAISALRGDRDGASSNHRYQLDSVDVGSGMMIPAHAGGSVARTLRLELETRDRAALERTALVVEVDAERTIEIPLSAALVHARDAAEVDSLALAASGSTWTLRLPMPFAQSLRVALEDRGAGRVRATAHLRVEPMTVDDSVYRLFATHVGPHDLDISDQPVDIRLAEFEGEGRFVGLVLETGNTDSLSQWWGEGDPTITIDDEASMRGTGTEDHFLYAFCSTERFRSPFSGQTRANALDSGGYVTLYRFHTSDDLPFDERFVFDLEMLAWGTGHDRTLILPTSGVAWFYGRPGTISRGTSSGEPRYEAVEIPAQDVRPGEGVITCG